jgi:hypothetical protein
MRAHIRNVHRGAAAVAGSGAAAAGFFKELTRRGAAAAGFLKIHRGSGKFIGHRVAARFFYKPSRRGSGAVAFCVLKK